MPIKKLITSFQNKEKDFYNDILNIFSDKLSYWKKRLNNPDADSDLNYFLFMLLSNIDINKFATDNDTFFYIKACIENKGRKIERDIKKSKTREICCCDSSILENEKDCDSDNVFSNIELMDSLKALNKNEKIIIYKRYFLQFTDAELAEELHISRQAVNKSRKKALGKIVI